MDGEKTANHLQGISDQSGAVLTTGGISEAVAKRGLSHLQGISDQLGAVLPPEVSVKPSAQRGQPPARYQRPIGSGATTGGISGAVGVTGPATCKVLGRRCRPCYHRRYE